MSASNRCCTMPPSALEILARKADRFILPTVECISCRRQIASQQAVRVFRNDFAMPAIDRPQTQTTAPDSATSECR